LQPGGQRSTAIPVFLSDQIKQDLAAGKDDWLMDALEEATIYNPSHPDFVGADEDEET
jgi:hypothetical protein